jgi:hypothetical protein
MKPDASPRARRKGRMDTASPSGSRREQRADRSDTVAPAGHELALSPWHLFVVGVFAAATVAIVLTRDAPAVGVLLVCLLIASGGWAGLALHRTLWPLVSAEASEDGESLGDRTRATLGRERDLALRSIRDLDFDRSMGKIEESDYAEMADRLRARVARLTKQLDDGTIGYRELVERDIEARLAQGSRFSAQGAIRGQRPEPEAMSQTLPSSVLRPQSSALGPEPAQPVCAECQTQNDPDARFCKSCGARLGTAT